MPSTDGIVTLLGSYVRYEVTEGRWELLAASPRKSTRTTSLPAQEQTPERDLAVTEITALSEIGFEDWKRWESYNPLSAEMAQPSREPSCQPGF